MVFLYYTVMIIIKKQIMSNIVNLKNQPVKPPGERSTKVAIKFQKWFEPAKLSKDITYSGICEHRTVENFTTAYEIDHRSVEGCQGLRPSDCWERFPTVNDFFIRRRVNLPLDSTSNKRLYLQYLKEQYEYATGHRAPQNVEKRIIVSPADNYCVYLPEFAIRDKLWIKGRTFSVGELFQTKSGAGGPDGYPIGGGPDGYQLCVFRLAPHHYHRYHSPISGKVLSMRYTGSEYFSVAPQIVNSSIDVYTRNVRLVLTLENFRKEKIWMCIIGATCVGSIQITHPNILERFGSGSGVFAKSFPRDREIRFRNPPRIRVNDELGNFQFGGSTIVLAVPQTYTLTNLGQIVARNTLTRSKPYETEIQVGQVVFV
jgi:phosphatidylserine decarboxylase precursor